MFLEGSLEIKAFCKVVFSVGVLRQRSAAHYEHFWFSVEEVIKILEKLLCYSEN